MQVAVSPLESSQFVTLTVWQADRCTCSKLLVGSSTLAFAGRTFVEYFHWKVVETSRERYFVGRSGRSLTFSPMVLVLASLQLWIVRALTSTEASTGFILVEVLTPVFLEYVFERRHFRKCNFCFPNGKVDYQKVFGYSRSSSKGSLTWSKRHLLKCWSTMDVFGLDICHFLCVMFSDSARFTEKFVVVSIFLLYFWPKKPL